MFSKILAMNQDINELYMEENRGYSIALVGNPNVGKSTVFNALTGLRQHTGNWPGKTVSLASGNYIHKDQIHEMIDLPGTYSLLAHSSEEEVTRDYICFKDCDVCVVVCDATCLERNLNLVLQTLEITNKVVVCLNFCDEARKKHIEIDQQKLETLLGVEVICMSARNLEGFEVLKDAVDRCGKKQLNYDHILLRYDDEIEISVKRLSKAMHTNHANPRFLALKLLNEQSDTSMFFEKIVNKETIQVILGEEKTRLSSMMEVQSIEDHIVHVIAKKAKEIGEECITFNNSTYFDRDRKIDRIVTHKLWGIALMIILLFVIFWITISAANVPSAMLSELFGYFEAHLHALCIQLNLHPTLHGLLVDGIYKTLAWVVSVMLPPMAIFFPLFTILEDFGYLPRIAFNLDGYFQKAKACGKQALTMCLGIMGMRTSSLHKKA